MSRERSLSHRAQGFKTISGARTAHTHREDLERRSTLVAVDPVGSGARRDSRARADQRPHKRVQVSLSFPATRVTLTTHRHDRRLLLTAVVAVPVTDRPPEESSPGRPLRRQS